MNNQNNTVILAGMCVLGVVVVAVVALDSDIDVRTGSFEITIDEKNDEKKSRPRCPNNSIPENSGSSLKVRSSYQPGTQENSGIDIVLLATFIYVIMRRIR